VLVLVVRQAAWPVATGVVAGAIGAGLASQLLTTQLVNVQPTDPLTFTAGIVALGAIALVAALIPARRAAATDPARTMR
jgi:ABC-type lipoprotein release transport system permease subunit